MNARHVPKSPLENQLRNREIVHTLQQPTTRNGPYSTSHNSSKKRPSFTKPYRSLSTFQTLLLTAAVFLCVDAEALLLDTVLDRHLVKESEMIFGGDVVRVEYRSSSPKGEEAPIPHTYVTFAIRDIYKGSIQDRSQITLRFQGGPTGDGRVLQIEGVPLFDVGDASVLFVRGNGEDICPLVGWWQGWTRVLEDRVYDDGGRELLLTDDVIVSRRFHPKDIRNPEQFAASLLNAEGRIAQIVWGRLSAEAKLLIEDPANIKKINPRLLVYRLPPNKFSDSGGLLEQLIPAGFRQVPRSLLQTLLFRDMNGMLLDPHLFSENDVGGLALDTSLQELLRKNRDQFTLEETLVLNRRLLELAFPDEIVRSLPKSIVLGEEVPLQEARTHDYGEVAVEWIEHESDGAEGETPRPEPPQGKPLNVQDYVTHLVSLIQAVHSPEDLQKLPPVINADIGEELFLQPPVPVRVTTNLQGWERTVTDPDEQEELRLYLESGQNPVLKVNP